MGQIELTHGLRDMSWFFRIERSGLAFTNRTESAVSRADVAAEHERRSSIRPAFKNVWTTSFLTNRVQVKSLDQLQHVVLIGWIAQPDLQPFRLWLTDFGIVTDDAELAGQLDTSFKVWLIVTPWLRRGISRSLGQALKVSTFVLFRVLRAIRG